MCGLYGVVNHEDAANLTLQGIEELQHRGYDGAGIAYTPHYLGLSYDVERITTNGLVSDLKLETSPSERHSAIAHCRYKTSNTKTGYSQPIGDGHIEIAHNGSLTGVPDGKHDTTYLFERIIYHLEHSAHLTSSFTNYEGAIIETLKEVTGSYSLLILTKDKLFACRDRFGFRPLYWSSKDLSYDLAGEVYERRNPVYFSSERNISKFSHAATTEVKPGTILTVDLRFNVIYETKIFENGKARPCVFEDIYFKKCPDRPVTQFRVTSGKYLAIHSPANAATCVVPVPDSGREAAEGFAKQACLPTVNAIAKRDTSRSFIQADEYDRNQVLQTKFQFDENLIRGKSIVLVDDSIVRGNTLKFLIDKLKTCCGVSQIHVRIASPPIVSHCLYGIDIQETDSLLMKNVTCDEVSKQLGVDTLAFHDNIYKETHCTSCFTGHYYEETRDNESEQLKPPERCSLPVVA